MCGGGGTGKESGGGERKNVYNQTDFGQGIIQTKSQEVLKQHKMPLNAPCIWSSLNLIQAVLLLYNVWHCQKKDLRPCYSMPFHPKIFHALPKNIQICLQIISKLLTYTFHCIGKLAS